MRVDRYALLRDQIEKGLGWGIRRAYKYDAAPKTEEQMAEQTDQMMHEIMNAVCEYFVFDEPADGDES
jgi:hypothetical protein